MAEHEWGPLPNHPDWDGAQCKKCGLKATGVQIATDMYGDKIPSCPYVVSKT